MTKIKIVHLNELYNFVVENFFIWVNLVPQNVFWKISLPRANREAFAEGLPIGPRQRVFAEGRPSAKTLFAEGLPYGPRQRDFLKYILRH